MGAMLEHFATAGVRFELLPDRNLRVYGTLTDDLRTAIRERKPNLVAELETSARHFRWRIAMAGGDDFEVRVVPEATLAEMRSLYPGADCQRLDDLPDEQSTCVAAPAPDTDNRRTCAQCRNLATSGICLAATRGDLAGISNRKYTPANRLPKRCEAYQPNADDTDRRSGLERWPCLRDTPTSDQRRQQDRHAILDLAK